MSSERPKSSTPQKPPPIPVQELFGDQREIEIAYRGEIYRLRMTRNEKLILTK